MSYNRQAIADALAKMNKARKPKQPKDIIKDPEGQYKYPGIPTRIPSDEITMQDVPYPVLGVDNLGNEQVMQPGKKYVFSGADYVDEFPIAKYGGLVTGLTNTSGNLLMNKKGKRMMAQSGSLSATNKMFLGNPLVTKRKKSVFVPGAPFQEGGSTDWKSRIASAMKFQQGGANMSPEELAKRKQYYEKVTGRTINQQPVRQPLVEPQQEQPVVTNSGWTGFKDDNVLIYNEVQTTPVKDKWGRGYDSAWFGFDPEKREFTVVDPWKRKPGDELYGFDPEKKIYTKGSKGSKTVRVRNTYIYDDKELTNPSLIKNADECLTDPVTGQSTCLGSSFRYYDKHVAPNLNLPNSWQMKENAGLSSGKTHSKFKKVGESWDSWELAGGLLDAGGKLYYTGGPEGKGWRPSEDEWRKLNLPVGTVINWGNEGRGKTNYQETYNEKKGLSPSNHSTMIIGYDKTGLPIIYDFGEIVRVTEPKYPGVGVTNIVASKEITQANRTFDKVSKDKNLSTSSTQYRHLSKTQMRKNVDELSRAHAKTEVTFKDGKASTREVSHTNKQEMYKFADLLVDKKEKYMSVMGLDNEQYDEYAKRAMATAFVESRGGDKTIRRKGLKAYDGKRIAAKYLNPFLPEEGGNYIPGKIKSHGLTQIRTDNLWGDPKISRQLNELGITEKNYDPYKTEHIVPATIALLKNTDRVAQANLGKHKNNKTDLHPAMVNYYQWMSPGRFLRGEVQGDAIAAKRFMNYYDNIKFQQGGQLSREEFERRKAVYKKMTGRDVTEKNIATIKKQQNLQKFIDEIDEKKPLRNSLPKSESEAWGMIESGEIKLPTLGEIRTQAKKEADEREADRIARLKAYEKRQADPNYGIGLTPLPGETWRDFWAAEGSDLDAKFRFSQKDNFFDDYINPAVWVGSMAKNLGEAPKQAKKTWSILPYVTAVGTPLLAGAALGTGTNNTGQFINNIINPVPGLTAPAAKWSKELVEGSLVAGKPKLPEFLTVMRTEAKDFDPTKVAASPYLNPTQQSYTGHWMQAGSKKNPQAFDEMMAYISGAERKNPGDMQLLAAEIPWSKAQKSLGQNLPIDAKTMSFGPGVYNNLENLLQKKLITPREYVILKNYNVNSQKINKSSQLSTLRDDTISKLRLNPETYNPNELLNGVLVSKLRSSPLVKGSDEIILNAIKGLRDQQLVGYWNKNMQKVYDALLRKSMAQTETKAFQKE
jgi:hypothetical protein